MNERKREHDWPAAAPRRLPLVTFCWASRPTSAYLPSSQAKNSSGCRPLSDRRGAVLTFSRQQGRPLDLGKWRRSARICPGVAACLTAVSTHRFRRYFSVIGHFRILLTLTQNSGLMQVIRRIGASPLAGRAACRRRPLRQRHKTRRRSRILPRQLPAPRHIRDGQACDARHRRMRVHGQCGDLGVTYGETSTHGQHLLRPRTIAPQLPPI